MSNLNAAKISLAALIACALIGCSGGGGGSADTGTVIAAPQIHEAVRKTEAVLDGSTPIHVVLGLYLNDKPGLDNFVTQIQNPSSPNYRQTLTPAQITAQFGPTPAQVSATTAFLRQQGFTNISVTSSNVLVEADAPSRTVATAFKTTLAQYTMPDGTLAHANTAPIMLPSSLTGIVQSVLGLDTVNRAHPYVVSAPAATTVVAAGTSVISHNPTAFPMIYNVGTTPSGANINVGIIAEGKSVYINNAITDLTTFEQQNGLVIVPVSAVYPGAPSVDTKITSEWDLDSQAIVGMSGGVKQLTFYVATSYHWSDLATAISAAQTANTAQVVNMSIGGCEQGALTSQIDSILEMAVAQGQTFVVASGDSGSNPLCTSNPAVEYPASSPYVVAVSGTTLTTNTNGSYASETTWNNSYGASGGGISVLETIPSWQSIVPLLSGTSYRGVPDIAFDADPLSGATIIVNGQSATGYGGTSLAAPLFAATWARMLANPSCGNLGFAAPTLYAYQSRNPTMFQDITTGNNGAYSAGIGWDAATGWGTPNISNMWAAVCPTGAAYYWETEQLFIAYLGRPIAPAGLAYYAGLLQAANAPTNIVQLQQAYSTNTAVKNIINGIESSAESLALYPTTNTSAYVTALFQAILNRAPLPAGLAYFVNGVNNGTIPLGDLALDIMVTAEGTRSDYITLENKTAVAANFTATLTSSQATYYTGTTALKTARDMLQLVSSSSSDPVDVVYVDQPIYVS
ncbi:MAG: protease pro-enzyme activation domain-containing protein [Burkholderiales bacterium]